MTKTNIKETATTIINAIKELNVLPRFIDGVNETKLVSFLRGANQGWLKEADIQSIIEVSETYGKGSEHGTSWWGRALRQCVALGLVDMTYTVSSFNNFYKTSRRYVASMKGKRFVEKPYDISVLDPSVDPFDVKKTSSQRNKAKTNSRGIHFLPKIKNMLKEKSRWVEINSKEDYEFPGFSKDNGKVLFTENFKTLPFAAKNRMHFISEDNQLTTRGSQTKKLKTEVDGVETEVFVKRGPCEGVKICSADNCSYTVANRQLKNKCKEHGSSKPLTRTGKCPIHFVYIWPTNEHDGRRWLGVLTAEGEVMHNHPRPAEHKISSKVSEDIQQIVHLDITKTSKDLLKGKCIPDALTLFNLVYF